MKAFGGWSGQEAEQVKFGFRKGATQCRKEVGVHVTDPKSISRLWNGGGG